MLRKQRISIGKGHNLSPTMYEQEKTSRSGTRPQTTILKVQRLDKDERPEKALGPRLLPES